jgi:hypothetical protein
MSETLQKKPPTYNLFFLIFPTLTLPKSERRYHCFTFVVVGGGSESSIFSLSCRSKESKILVAELYSSQS